MSFSLSKLPEIIDVPGFESLMNDFHELAGIPVALIDVEGRVLVGVGWQDICTRFHRVHPETCRACIESDTTLSAGIAPGEFRLYRCKNSMWDVATPLFVDGRHIANVFSGQFFLDDETVDEEVFRRQARRYGFDEPEYMAALDRVPRVSRELLDRGLAFFTKLAQMLSRQGEANVRLARAIDERDRLMESLRNSEADLSRAQRVAQTGSWRLDVRRNVLTWSDEAHRMFRVPRDTLLTYETFLSFVHPDDRAVVDEAWQAALRGRPYDVDHRIVVGDVVSWVRERAELEFDDRGRLLGGFGTVQDITERKRLEAELLENVAALAEANRLKDEFLSTLSHELRTPLNAVIGWTELLLQDRVPAERTRRALETIERNARAQLSLVNDLLDVARVVSGKLCLQLKDVEVAACLDAALDAVRPAAAAKHIRLERFVEGTPTVRADAERLQQVLWNLLSNAVKFTPLGGRVEAVVREAAARVEMTVRDTGVGIPPEFIPHVFDRFSQADGSTSRHHGGLGIGLAIVRHLVELHGGEVRAESKGVGCGSTFTVVLRSAKDAAAREAVTTPNVPEATDGVAAASSLTGLRLLIVDDEEDGREILLVLLSGFGANVRTASGSREAIQIVQAWRPHLVVCDIAMPGEDGYAFIRQLRAVSARDGGSTPVLALTASAGAHHRARALASGFAEHVTKPVDPTTLAETIRAIAATPGGA